MRTSSTGDAFCEPGLELLPGEDAAAYDVLYRGIRAAITPKDIIEDIWARDIADLSWDALRYRRWRAKYLAKQDERGLEAALRGAGCSYDERSQLMKGWTNGNKAAIGMVKDVLLKAGLDHEVVAAANLSSRLDTFERIEAIMDRGHRNLWHLLLGADEDVLDRGMVGLLHQNIEHSGKVFSRWDKLRQAFALGQELIGNLARLFHLFRYQDIAGKDEQLEPGICK